MKGQNMKIRRLIVGLACLAIPLYAAAGWVVAKPDSTIPSEPFFHAGKQQRGTSPHYPRPIAYSQKAYPNQFATLGQPAPVYAVSISGSLKENLERIMSRYHWRVIWKAPYDYNFDGRVTGSSLPNVIEKLLQPFPVQAVMYMSNRTMAVTPKA